MKKFLIALSLLLGLVSFTGTGVAQTINFTVPEGYTYTGLGAAPDAANHTNWNTLTIGGTTTGSVNSAGAATGITVTMNNFSTYAHGGAGSPYNQPQDLFRTFATAPVSGVINNVSAGTYNLFLYGINGSFLDGRLTTFTVWSDLTSSNSQTTTHCSTDTQFILGENYVEFIGLQVGGVGQINFNTAGAVGNTEPSFNGLQLQSFSYLIVGSNTSGNSTNFTSGTYSYTATYVGQSAGSSNNSLTISGSNTLLINDGDTYNG